MISRNLLILFAILFPAAVPIQAQTEITGMVRDGESGETLPSATLLLEGTYRGTITNGDGLFSIQVDRLPVVLTVRYIGYESRQVEVTGPENIPLEIDLHPSVTELDEITVTDRDPGLSIMETVIARKQIWRNGLETYRAEAYTRQTLGNDTSVVSVAESRSQIYWDREKGHREVQLGRRQTSNLSGDQNFAGVRYQPNFYDDNIEIAGYTLAGITHPDALRYYHFRLKDTKQMDGKPVYEIDVIPRKTRQPLFKGTARVLGRDYALLEVDLKPNETVRFPPPVQEFDLSYRQQFSNFGGEYWLPVDMHVEGRVRIGMTGLRFPLLRFRQVSLLTNYGINTVLPDSLFRDNESLIRRDVSESELIGETSGQIPLTEEEITAYETIDSTQTLEEAFKPEGFLARMAERSEQREKRGWFGEAGQIFPSGLSLRARFNRMDGFHPGLRYQQRLFGDHLRIEAFAGYGFYSNLWEYGGAVDQRLLKMRNTPVHLVAEYGRKTAPRYESAHYTPGINSVVALLGGKDYFDYYRNEYYRMELHFFHVFPKFNLELSGRREFHGNFDPESLFDYSLFNWHTPRRQNPAIEEGTLQTVGITLEYNRAEMDFGFSGRRQVSLDAELSRPALGSDFEFTRVSAGIDWNFNTFYSRRLFANTVDVHLSGGISDGRLPLQRYGIVDGSMLRFAPFGTLKTRTHIPYEGERYWLAVAEHNFRTIPFELLRLEPLVERGWGIIVFGGAGYAGVRNTRSVPENVMTSKGIHSEIGVSLNSIFGILRLDFAKRLDAPGFFAGLSVPRYF